MRVGIGISSLMCITGERTKIKSIWNTKITLNREYVIFWDFMPRLSTTTNDSCPVSRQTMEVVDDCPDTEGKWREAAVRKDCSAYASQCDEPERLVYHCVINSFANQTLEVCAYSKNILLGVCTEYSLSGNRIQQNKLNCSDTGPTSCPTGYNSTVAYKYPVCYKLAKEIRRKEEPRTNKTDMFSTKNSTQNGKPEGKKKSTECSNVVIGTCLAALVIVILIAIPVYERLLRRKDSQQNDDHHREGPRARRKDVEENN